MPSARISLSTLRTAAIMLAIVTALALITTLWGPSAQATPKPDDPLWKPKQEKSVPVTDIKPKAPPVDQAELAASKFTPKVSWPKAGTAEVAVPAAKANVPALLASGRTVTPKARAGVLPIAVGSAEQTSATARAAATPGKVRVDLARRGTDGLLVKLTRADGLKQNGKVSLQLNYDAFRDTFGGDWALRLRLLELPACALTKGTATPDCQGTPVETRNNGDGTLTGDVTVGDATKTYAIQAAASGGAGNFGASQLMPSATWQVGGSSGDFSWNYPMAVPPSTGGPAPQIALGYVSGGVDGRTSSTNNQPSWVGQGFDLQPGGSIERRYASCASKPEKTGNNGTRITGDLCWSSERGLADNATFTLNGAGGELVRDDTTGKWRPRNDDGSTVVKLDSADNGDDGRTAADKGEHWLLTTKDGTKYYFGLNKLPGGTEATNSSWTVPVYGNHSGEQCHATAFADSWCQQTYKWNLDYVVDKHGNTMSLYYDTEANYYGRNSTATAVTKYTRSGSIKRIEYGQLAGALGTGRVGRVTFDTTSRCIENSPCATQADYPDVPMDQRCINADGSAPAKCENKHNATFFTMKKLSKVTAEIWRGASGYQPVSSWTLRYSFPDNGDGTSRSLWMTAITHAGHVGNAGGVAIPEVNFDGVPMANRVDPVGDQLPPMNWWRMTRVNYGTGGYLNISYYPEDCRPGDTPAPDSNGRRCHPMKWTPPGATTEQTDWFHKYVVKSVEEHDLVSESEPMVTTLEYPNAPMWRHDDEDGLVEIGQKTWSQWRGYDVVITKKGHASGPQIVTENRYYRGMDGDKTSVPNVYKDVKVEDSTGVRVDDQLPLAGQPREVRTFNGDGVLVDRTITDPWVSTPTATRVRTWGTTSAFQTQQQANRQVEALAGGGFRESGADNQYDVNGVLLKSNDRNDLSTTADDTCTSYEYTKNDALGITEMPKRELTVAKACDLTYTKDDVIGDNRTFYDNATSVDTAPVKGDVTKTERLKGFATDGTAQYETVSTMKYDGLGRTTEVADALNQKSTTIYTPSGAGPVTKIESSKPNGQKTTIELEPAWGEEVAITDETGKRTEATYDALGRTDQVWYPGRAGTATSTIRAGTAGANVAGRAAAADNAAIADVDYDYGIFANKPNFVTTKAMQTNGTIETSYQLYDGLMRPKQTQEAAQGGGRIISDVVYDSRGLEVKENGPYHNPGAPVPDVVVEPDELRLPTQKITEYDLAGRPIKEIVKSENEVKWETNHTYSGDRESVDPPDGDTPITRITDVQGRLLELRQFRGDTPTGTDYDSTKYTYTKSGQLETVTDPANNRWIYEYDVQGRTVKETDPDTGTTTFTFDELDRMKTKTDGRGATLAYEYDSIGRTKAIYEGSLQGHKRASWVYDTLMPGLPTSSTSYDANDNAYTTRITGYDTAGRATGTEYVIPENEGELAGTYRFDSTYHQDGQLATETLPGIGGLPAETLTYGYDEKDQPTTLASASSTYVRETGYTRFGEVQTVKLGATGGKWVEMGYTYETGTRRLTQVVTQKETLPRMVSTVDYAYDQSGNITKITDTPSSTSGAPTDTQCFTYDYLRRMEQAWTPKPGTDNLAGDCEADPSVANLGGPAPYWQAWTFDKTGNRKTETKRWTGGSTTATYTYPNAGAAQPHTLRSVVTTGTGMPAGGRTDSYAYNENGELKNRTVAGAGETYTWNPDGDLEKVTKNGQETSFLYDANGDRLIRRDTSGTTLYLGETELSLKAGAVTGTRYYEHGGQTIAVRVANNLHWLANDHHGTATTAIDNTATQNAQRRRQDPYGNGRGTDATAWPGQRTFVGGTADSSTGLIHLGARLYDPTIGRFISVDPQLDIEDPQTLNGYSYGNNNPVSFSDPDGMSWFSSIVSSVTNVAKTVTKRVTDTVKEAVKVVTPVVNWVRDRATDTFSAVRSFVAKTVEVTKKIVKTVKTVVKVAVKVVKKVTKKIAQVAKKAVAKVKQVAKAVVKVAKAVAHKVAAVAVKAAKWVYENRAAIMMVVAEIALTVAVGALTGGVGALAVRGVVWGLRAAASAKRATTASKIAQPLWSATKTRTPVQNAFKHFKDHGKEFDDVGNSLEYVAKGQKFVRKPPLGTKTINRTNGDVVRYHRRSNNFGVMNSSGAPKSFFKPDPAQHGHPTNMDYFRAQQW